MMERSYRKRIYSRYTSERMPAFLSYRETDYARDAKAILHRLRGWLPVEHKSRCLDVACGVGQLLYALKMAGYTNLTGVDISREQVTVAKKVWPDVREAEAISFLRQHPEAFDLITGFDIVEHFAKDELFSFLDALYDALRPGGRVIFQTPNAESPWGLMLRYGDLTHEVAFDSRSLSHVLSLAGFEKFEVRGCGPYIHGARSMVRWVIWRCISAGLRLWNLAETGSAGSGVYTRVFLAKADKPTVAENRECFSKAIERRVKIVYVGPLSSGGTCLMRMRALQSLGHQVIGIDTEPPTPTLIPYIAARVMWRLQRPLDLFNTNSRIVCSVLQQRPEIVWIDKGLSVRPETLSEIHRFDARIHIVGYSPDDMGRRHNQSIYFLRGLPDYDWFFTTKTFNVEELRVMGAKRPRFVANGFDPETHRPTPVTAEDRRELGGPVGFIGSSERERAVAMLALAQAGVPVRVWGWRSGTERWLRHPNLRIEGRHVKGLEYARGICSFDINLGFLRKLNRDHQTTRSVEIPACGAFMLAERTDEHLQLFDEGKEAEFFGSIEEMIDKCKFYLTHEEIRRKISAAGRIRCLKSGYSNHDRMATMLQQVLGSEQSGS